MPSAPAARAGEGRDHVEAHVRRLGPCVALRRASSRPVVASTRRRGEGPRDDLGDDHRRGHTRALRPAPGASRASACRSCRARRSGETARVSPMLCGKSSGMASTSSTVRPVMPCARMLANPRVVGASGGRRGVHRDDAVGIDLDDDVDGRLALDDPLAQLGVALVLRRHGRQLVARTPAAAAAGRARAARGTRRGSRRGTRGVRCRSSPPFSHAPRARRRSARRAPRRARRRSTIGTRTALPHSVHEPS